MNALVRVGCLVKMGPLSMRMISAEQEGFAKEIIGWAFGLKTIIISFD